jgi:hypothetical protein
MPQPVNPLIRIAEDDVNTPSTGLPNKKEPTPILQTVGYDKDQIVAGNHLNYILDNLADHIAWLQEQVTTQNTTILDQQIKVDGFYLGGTANPATHLNYGTWVQVEADITLRSAVADGTTASGDNDPAVPLLEHNHAITVDNDTHSHTFSGTTDSDSHTHTLGTVQNVSGSGQNVDTSQDAATGTTTTSQNTHSHTFTGTTDNDQHNHTASSANTGDAAPTLDVRGRHLDVVMWKRTA